ncbi:hypothetical protein [Pedobacter gandavensis]|uniref:Uncharacterized protein n=1 Tax=Pedobacter gandavensis TaxID=2679963 RepID=A0ABR6EVC0_9SPHI|nr:hypothetical protein [Pedobacter gandavensis]MBB2148962.1 hypothetical protein [Pedobacter gandavensis]
MKKNHNHRVFKLIDKYVDAPERYSTKVINTNLSIPANFRMLCALTGVAPVKILSDFMWIVSSSYVKESACIKREAAIDYFIKCSYGQDYYHKDDLLNMLKELEAVRVVDEMMTGCSGDKLRLFYCFKNMQAPVWFKKWFNKSKRLESISVLDQY